MPRVYGYGDPACFDPLCKKSFSSKYNLMKHVKFKHPFYYDNLRLESVYALEVARLESLDA